MLSEARKREIAAEEQYRQVVRDKARTSSPLRRSLRYICLAIAVLMGLIAFVFSQSADEVTSGDGTTAAVTLAGIFAVAFGLTFVSRGA